MDYPQLKTAILDWLARPNDPLLVYSTPGFIMLFETEAGRRIKTAGGERLVSLPAVNGIVALPSDMTELRAASIAGRSLEYMPPDRLPNLGGEAWCYTIVDHSLVLGPSSGLSGTATVDLLYQVSIPPLSDAAPTNWLIEQAPDAYLFGSLCHAEAYIGHDERIQLWTQQREAAFAGIELADRKYRWGGPLQIRVDGISVARRTGSAGMTSGGGVAPGIPAGIEGDVPVRVVSPISGAIVAMTAGERALYIEGGPRDMLTIRLAPTPTEDMLVEIGFKRPVATLVMTDSAGFLVAEAPVNAYGPGAGLQFRYIDGLWRYWA